MKVASLEAQEAQETGLPAGFSPALSHIEKGQPFYWFNIGIQGVGFALRAASLGVGLLPGLHGESGDVRIFQAAARILAFAVPIVTWMRQDA